MPDIAPAVAVASPAAKAAPAKPPEVKAVAPAVETKVIPAAKTGPRWFEARMSGQSRVVNVLAVNHEEALARFKRGEGIRETPHEITVVALAEGYVPTAADLDHHNAIEAADSAEAKAQ